MTESPHATCDPAHGLCASCMRAWLNRPAPWPWDGRRWRAWFDGDTYLGNTNGALESMVEAEDGPGRTNEGKIER